MNNINNSKRKIYLNILETKTTHCDIDMNTKTLHYSIRYDDVLEFKIKNESRKLTRKAINDKTLIKPDHCNLCQKKSKVDAHHIDYGKPLDVIWVCKKCHGDVHKKKHILNPKNNAQTQLPVRLVENDFIKVTMMIPIKQYIAIKKESTERKIPLTVRIRQILQESIKINDNQLTFFDIIEDKNDKSQSAELCGIQSVGTDETSVLESKIVNISKPGRKRHKGMRIMDERLLSVL